MSFSESYAEARDRFRESALRAGAQTASLLVCDHAEHGSLTIDVAILNPGARRALVVSSGVHGVEGFAGSALQVSLLSDVLPEDVRIVLVHAVNPYGMACLRRVNEHNVDLNRNFLPSGQNYHGASDGYRRLYDLLHPRTPHRRFDSFVPRALFQIARYGMPALRQAVAGGQYDFPRGLFWGGERLERGPALLLEAFPDWLGNADRVVLLDFHTGLGRAHDHALFTRAEPGGEVYRRLRAAFGKRVQLPDPDESVGYRISGAFGDAVRRLLGPRVEPVTAEFGTYSPVRVIRALREENRAHFWGGDVVHAKALVREAFYPGSPRWRASFLEQAHGVVSRTIDWLRADG